MSPFWKLPSFLRSSSLLMSSSFMSSPSIWRSSPFFKSSSFFRRLSFFFWGHQQRETQTAVVIITKNIKFCYLKINESQNMRVKLNIQKFLVGWRVYTHPPRIGLRQLLEYSAQYKKCQPQVSLVWFSTYLARMLWSWLSCHFSCK